MSENTKPTGLALLRVPFPANQISKLPKPKSKDAVKGHCNVCGGWHGLPAVHLDYVGHAALTDRLLDADPMWAWEPLTMSPDGLPVFDGFGGMWIKLTVCGVTRLGYGDAGDKNGANAVKEVIGDALRNAAMRFGAALDLWHKGDLHADDDRPNTLEKQLEASVEQEKQKRAGVMGAVLEDLSLDTNTRVSLNKLGTAVQREFVHGPKAAFDLIEEQGLNQDERIFLWSVLPSNVRSALKVEGAARKEPA